MSSLRKNILIVRIKPHSSLQKYFRGTDIKADINHYADILEYIYSIHPDFLTYIRKQTENELQETFVFLDKDLREISKDEMFMRRAREDDVIHIVPAIVGGGGKRGIIALIAVAALMIAFPMIAGMASMAGTGLATTAGTVLWGTGATAMTLGTFVGTIGLNLALMGVTMLLAPKPAEAGESSRDNNAFGGLTNTTASGTPIALNYGLVRVAGQLITGYTDSIESTSSGEDVSLQEAMAQ
jgi:predicted phage tail protein